MYKKVALILSLLNPLLALHLEVDYGVEQNQRFSILTLKHSESFPCKEQRDIHDNVVLIECIIDKTPKSSFPKQNLEFFDIYNEVKNRKFHLFIKANKKIRLFANAFDLKRDFALPKERPSTSQNWQIIGFDKEIPFLSANAYNGLNFPINLADSTMPNIKELNMDATPLIFEEGADLNTFLTIRNNFLSKNYNEAIKAADLILENYADSIFTRDAKLYKIRAMNENGDFPDDIINLAKAWVKAYGTDTNIPEVLYIIADNYSKLRIYTEARYYFNRILEEFEDSKYAQYALVGMAKNLTANGDKRQSASLYAKAYQNAKDLDTASFVSLSWAKFALSNNDKQNARNLISKVINANPKYFLNDIAESIADFELWADSGLYDLSAKAGDSTLKSLENDSVKEKLMLNVANWFELADMPKDAYRVNSEFLELFANSKEKDSVKKRSDNLLFLLDEGDLEKQITQYDYIIATYPNSDNAKLAYQKKAQNLFDLKRYSEVLALKSHLPSDNEALKKSYIALIENSKSCDEIIPLWRQSQAITNNAKSVFDCLYNANLFSEAKALSTAMLPNAKNSKITWLYNEARANYALGEFKKAALSSSDVMNLAKDSAMKLNAGEILFFSYVNLNDKSEATKVFNALLKIAPNSINLIPLYNQMLHFALNSNDNIAIEKYATDLTALQNRHKSYEFSPFAELSYADVLFNDNRFSQMLKVLETLPNANEAEMQKAHYLRGYAHYELGQTSKAKAEFEKCNAINGDFKMLCREALKRF